jgi:hypothetical protein
MEPKVTKARKVEPWLEWLVPGNWKDYDPTWVRETGYDYKSGELLKSEGHPVKLLGGDPRLDIGGDFKVIRRSYSESTSFPYEGPQHFSIWNPWLHPMNDGVNHIFCSPKARFGFVNQDTFDSLPYGPHISSGTELDHWGAQAISHCLPNNPVADAQVLAGNTLQKGLPKIPIEHWSTTTEKFLQLGDRYLLQEFGWKPFISDIRKLAHAVKESDKILSKYHRESGKLLHRSFHFPVEEEEHVTVIPGFHMPAPFGDFDYFHPASIGKLTVTSKTTTKRWFKGAFTYYLPKMGSTAGRLSDANKLLGAGLTPSLVWELTPWSWAVNWFIDTSTLVKNLSGFTTDGLVMPYAYIMENSKTVTEYKLEGIAFKSYTYLRNFSQTFEVEVKQRRAATPWGFGVNTDDLTSHQLAILAALGLSHATGYGTINPNLAH